jgi:tetratricopeptide (TPR) repeat protein
MNKPPVIPFLLIFYLCGLSLAQAQSTQEQSSTSSRREGITYASEARFSEAEAWFIKHLKTHKDDHTSSGALAVIHDLNQGKITKETAVSLFSSLKLLEEGKTEEALAGLVKTIEISPNYARPYNILGVVYTSQGDTDKGARYFEKAIEINPGYSDAYYNLAAAQEALDRPDEALRNYQKSIELAPGSPDALIHTASLCASLGKYNEAIGYYKDALKISPREPEIYYNLALVYFMSEQLAKFRENLLKARELYRQKGDTLGLEKVSVYMNKMKEIESKIRQAK